MICKQPHDGSVSDGEKENEIRPPSYCNAFGEGSPSDERHSFAGLVDLSEALVLDQQWQRQCCKSQHPQRRNARSYKKDFCFFDELGEGSWGTVYLAQKRKSDSPPVSQQLYAIKSVGLDYLQENNILCRAYSERLILSKTSSPFIVGLVDFFQDQDSFYLVLEFCSGGDLFSLLQHINIMSEEMVQFYGGETLLALEHLHSKGILYRDLKPENIMLDINGHVKLTDFGLAKINVHDFCSGAQEICGTPCYMSPEIVRQEQYGLAADWWAFGCLLFEMFAGYPPWFCPGEGPAAVFQQIKFAPLRFPRTGSAFPATARQLVTALLRAPAAGGAAAVKAHAFWGGLDWQELSARKVVAPFKPSRKLNDDMLNFASLSSLSTTPAGGEEADENVNQEESPVMGNQLLITEKNFSSDGSAATRHKKGDNTNENSPFSSCPLVHNECVSPPSAVAPFSSSPTVSLR